MSTENKKLSVQQKIDSTVGTSERKNIVYELRRRRKIERQEARGKFKRFVMYTKHDYTFKWFHDIISIYLDKLVSRDIKKLMVFMPPQHGKTELSSRRFPPYVLGRNPNEKLILGSYNSTKAEEFLKDCKRIMQSKEYQEVFPEIKLNGVLKADLIEVNKGSGFIKSAGMDSGVTGTPATGIIIDDPFKGRNEANSEAIRKRVWASYNDDFLTRLDNNYFILMLFTRWHADDIAGRILDRENEHFDEKESSEWVVLVFQALKEEVLPIEQAIEYEDPREIDGALWEEKHAREKYVTRRRTNPTGFNSLDQQRPSALEGNKILREWFEIKNEKELPFSIQNITPNFIIDGAFTESTKNDETALLTYYFDAVKGVLYILNCIGIRKELYQFLPFFKEYATQNGRKANSTVWIEPKASGKPMKSMLSKMEYGLFNCREIPNNFVELGKWNRVENSESFLASGKVVLLAGSWNKRFIDQCATFPNAKNDDMVDDLTYSILLNFMKPNNNYVTYKK